MSQGWLQVIDERADAVDRGLVERIERHSVIAWPPATVERTDDGWILRATPGLARGRSNHALTPVRPLTTEELDRGLEQAAAFAERQGIPLGIQVSPAEVHESTLTELGSMGWDIQPSVQVLTASVETITAAPHPELELIVSEHADAAWLDAWARCEPPRAVGGPGLDVGSHVRTVFPLMAGRASFCRHRDLAVGIAVQDAELVALFCLAVAPHARRRGIGRALVRAMLARATAPTAYLQVFTENSAGIALYHSLGFGLAYRYRHCVAPVAG